MGVRGEIFSSRVILANRTYFFNVKENRMGDVYLNIVESKNRDNGGFDRQSVILFADDLQEFLKGFDEALKVLEKSVREKRRSGGDNEKRDKKPRQGERAERADKAVRGERAGHTDKAGRNEKPWRGEKAGRGGKDRYNRVGEKSERTDRSQGRRSERGPERGSKAGKRFVVKRQDRQP